MLETKDIKLRSKTLSVFRVNHSRVRIWFEKTWMWEHCKRVGVSANPRRKQTDRADGKNQGAGSSKYR